MESGEQQSVQQQSVEQDSAEQTLRQTAPGWRLVLTAIGGPREVAGKLGRVAKTLRIWSDQEEIERRLALLHARGFYRTQPTRAQLVFGALDMFRFVIVPAARDYYGHRGIDFNFHQLLRFLDDPVSMMDPTGMLSDRDTIIGHVLQVTHLNPIYDLQLMEMFDDGLEEFERQVEQMVEGTHPRTKTIRAVIEDPGYHERLLEYVRRYRRDSQTSELVRSEQSLRIDPHYRAAEVTFATLPGYLDYCNKLPKSLPELLARYRGIDRFPLAYRSSRCPE